MGLFTSKLEEAIREQCFKGELGDRIRRTCKMSGSIDEAIRGKPYSYPTHEVWTNTCKRSEEDISEYKKTHNTYVHSGNNHITFALVPYEETFPNGSIFMPSNAGMDTIYDHQEQVVLDKHALIYRTINPGSITNSNGRANTDIGFGDMVCNSSRPTLSLLKCFFKDFAEHPYRYSPGNFGVGEKEGDVRYQIVLLFPKEELSLDEWWSEHWKEMRSSLKPNKRWGDFNLIYPNVIVPTFEQLGYEKVKQ